MLLLPAVSGSLNRLAFHAPLLLEPREPPVEVDPLLLHAERAESVLLGGEVLRSGGAAGVADQRGARGLRWRVRHVRDAIQPLGWFA